MGLFTSVSQWYDLLLRLSRRYKVGDEGMIGGQRSDTGSLVSVLGGHCMAV